MQRLVLAVLLIAGCQPAAPPATVPLPDPMTSPLKAGQPAMVWAEKPPWGVDDTLFVGGGLWPAKTGAPVRVVHDPGGADPKREVTAYIEAAHLGAMLDTKPPAEGVTWKVLRGNLRPLPAVPAAPPAP